MDDVEFQASLDDLVREVEAGRTTPKPANTTYMRPNLDDVGGLLWRKSPGAIFNMLKDGGYTDAEANAAIAKPIMEPTPKATQPIDDWLQLAIDFVDHYESAALISELARVAGDMGSAQALYDDPESRTLMMSLHLALNRHQKIAPRFRPFVGEQLTKSGKADRLTAAESQLSNDLQLVDMDWAIHRRMASSHGEPILFGGTVVCDEGRVDLAALLDIVQSRASMTKRINMAALDEIDQCQLLKLQTQSVRKRKIRIRQARPAVLNKLRAHAGKARSKTDPGQVDRIAAQWEALALARGSATDALRLLPFITGHPSTMDAAAMRDRKRKLRSILGADLCRYW